MKKRKRILVFMLLIIVTGTSIYMYQGYKAIEREKYIKKLYHTQSLSYPRTNARFEQYEYFDYSIINERQLYIGLMAYNENQNKDLTLDDVKEYLAEPYNDDGSLRVETGWDEMYAYEEWCVYVGADEYREKLNKALYFYDKEIGNKDVRAIKDLSIEQLSELVKKIKDPDYEIAREVMGD